MTKTGTVVGVGDTHFPFCDKAKLASVIAFIKDVKPSIVIQVGDLYDMYSFSRFSRSVNLMTPKEEVLQATADGKAFWKAVKKAAPKAEMFQLVGNHSTTRIIKNILAKAPEYEAFVAEATKDLLKFDGVTTATDHRAEFHFGDWVAIHGWSTRPLFHANYFNKSVLCGHTHRGGIATRATASGTIFELNCGHIADIRSVPLQYTETATSAWVSGLGVIDKHGPRFIHV